MFVGCTVQAETQKVPVVYFLSGLTCTEQIFITKVGRMNAQLYLALILTYTSHQTQACAPKIACELGIAIVCPGA